MKKVFIHGIASGLLSALAAFVYSKVYLFATGADFSKVVNAESITGLNLIVALLASLAYYAISKKIAARPMVWFSVLFTMATFVSFFAPISFKLPFDVASPELFLGLVIPMQLFPQLFWISSKPLFDY